MRSLVTVVTVRLYIKWSSINKHMGQTAQVKQGPEMNLPRLPCRHPGFQMVSVAPHGLLCLCAASMFLEQIMAKSAKFGAHAVCSCCLEHCFQQLWSSGCIQDGRNI